MKVEQGLLAAGGGSEGDRASQSERKGPRVRQGRRAHSSAH